MTQQYTPPESEFLDFVGKCAETEAGVRRLELRVRKSSVRGMG